MPYLFLGQFARRAQQPEASLEYLNAAASCPLPENWPESHRQRFLALLHMERFQLAQASQDTELARDALGQLLKLDPDNAKLQGIYDGLPAEQ